MGGWQRATVSDQQFWQVRIRVDDRVRGAGLSLDGSSVLTCAHVVEGATELYVEFPAAPETTWFRASVRDGCWFPRTDEDGGDIAVLELEGGSVPDDWRAPLRQSPIHLGERVVTRGYPRGFVERGLNVEATLVGRCGPRDEWVQTKSEPQLRRVRRGFSGAGVVELATGDVVGMVVEEYTDPAEGLAWMIPVETIIGYLPGLEDVVAGSAAVDPVFTEDAGVDNVQLAKDLVAWCDGRTPDAQEIVTEHPGSPDFRTLRHVVALADRRRRLTMPAEVIERAPPGTVPPVGSIALALDAAGRSVAEIERRIDDRFRGTERPANVVVVDVDLAENPEDLMRNLLDPLVESGFRLLLGFRERKASGSLSIESGRSPMPSVSPAEGHWVGADLVPLPVLNFSDPTERLLADPEVPKGRRFCASCQQPVGREPDVAEGTCPNCRERFSFRPTLRRGVVVGNRYKVLGCLARGGMGWVFLAVDTDLDNHYVVLKGLFNSRNERARRLAAAERKSLIDLNHHGIVRIIGFVTHPDSRTGKPAEYIVLEYVEGVSLAELKSQLGGRGPLGEPLLVEHVLAYSCEILSALDYLHGLGLLFCDLKPHNVIRRRDRITLIDVGGVRRISDHRTPVVRTTRYSVPTSEIQRAGASVSSDLFALGKTLDELFLATVDGWRERNGIKSEVAFGIRSFHRLVRRATDPDPGRRFQSAAEMTMQVRGVLREILSLRGEQPGPEPSNLFDAAAVLVDGGLGTVPPLRSWTDPAPQRLPVSFRPTIPEIIAGIPKPWPSPEDPQASSVADLDETAPAAVERRLERLRGESVEVQLCRCRARINSGRLESARQYLLAAEGILAHQAVYDWRLEWHRGLLALANGAALDAWGHFDAVHAALPGDEIPKLAEGFCAEQEGELDQALLFYQSVWRRDSTQVNAAFGLARVYLASGRRWDAVAVLDDVAKHYQAVSVAVVRGLSARLDGPEGVPGVPEYQEVIERLSALQADGDSTARLVAAVREGALEWVRRQRAVFDGKDVLGSPVTERALCSLLETSYRALAKQARSAAEHGVLVDLANAARPRTLL